MESRQNLHILVLVGVFAILCDLGCLCPSLLLGLAKLNPLLHGQVLTELCELVGLETELVQDGAVLDWVEKNVVVWSLA